MNALVSRRRLRVVVDGVHEVVRGVRRETVCQQLRVERLIFQWGGRAGVWWRDDVGRGGVVLKWYPRVGSGVNVVPRLVSVRLGIHVEVDVDHCGVL